MSTVSSILGKDSSHNASQLSHQSQQQNAEAQAYRQNALGGYTNLQQAGQGISYNAQDTGNNALQNYLLSVGLDSNAQAPDGNFYNLSPDQNTELNGQLEAIGTAHQGALDNLKAELNRRGFSDPAAGAAGEALLNQHFAGLQAQQQAAYGEQVRQNRQGALGNLLNYAGQQQGQGLGAQEAGTSGIANLGAQAQGASAQSQAQSTQQQGQSNQAINNLLGIASFGLGGGFNKGGGAASSDGGAASGGGSSVFTDPNSGFNQGGFASPSFNSQTLG